MSYTDYSTTAEDQQNQQDVNTECYVTPTLLYDPVLGCDRKVFEITSVNPVTGNTTVFYYLRPDYPGYVPIGSSRVETPVGTVTVVPSAQRCTSKRGPTIYSGPDYPVPSEWYVPVKFATTRTQTRIKISSLNVYGEDEIDYDDDYQEYESLPGKGDINVVSDDEEEWSSDEY